MNRKMFLGVLASTVVIAGSTFYLASDTSNFTREDIKTKKSKKLSLRADEEEIMFLASLAPSGHNAQPWFIKYVEPYNWIICNDKTRWLPAVDPHQRETILSIGAFIQNLEFAASSLGYKSDFTLLATTNQDEHVMKVALTKTDYKTKYYIQKIKKRRTVRANYLNKPLKVEDLNYLLSGEYDVFNFIPNTDSNYQIINEQTIEANKLQSYRNPAERELANWIRFSSDEAEKKRDGLTTASMDINGIPGWVVRNFYDKASVMDNKFREQNISNVIKQVSQSAGWMLITSKDNSVASLIETGKQMQRLFLKVRDKNIAMHPMSQILEEPTTLASINQLLGINENIQFMLRIGYVKEYPNPVSLRRAVDKIVQI